MVKTEESHPTARPDRNPRPSRPPAGSWSSLVWVIPLTLAAIFFAVMVAVIREVEPFVLTMVVVLGLTGFTGRRFPRTAGPITVLVVLLVLLAMFLPSVVEDLSHPESAFNFIVFTVAPLTLIVLGVVAAIAAVAGRGSNSGIVLAYGAAAVIGVAVVVGLAAAAGLEDDVAVAGDIDVVAEKAKFTPATLATDSGSLGLYVDNRDPIRHTLAIDELGIEVELPANTTRRVELNAPPGSYEFVCTVPGHESMTGTITISG